MPEMISPAGALRKLLDGEDVVMAPGAFSPIVARLVAEAGFSAVYLTGAGIAAGLYGQPDVGLVTLSEVVAAARYTVESAGIPVICDADTGFGNPINVRRTVMELESAGVAALHIEDQTFPKKCGYFTGHTLVSPTDMTQRIQAAVDARRDPDLLLIARTEMLGARDLDETIARAQAYREAGADMIFVNGMRTEEEGIRVAKEVPGLLLYNVSSSGQAPHLHVSRLKELGYRLVIYPAHTLFFAIHGIKELLTDLKRDGDISSWLDQMIDFQEWQRLTEVPQIEDLERRYSGQEG